MSTDTPFAALAPADDPVTAPFWAGLRDGRLLFQRCRGCGHAWLPGSWACPQCLRADPGWVPASGAATLASWVVYHRAYHPAFAALVPYTIGLIALAEGPRLLAPLTGYDDPEALTISQPVRFHTEWRGPVAIPCFATQPQHQHGTPCANEENVQ